MVRSTNTAKESWASPDRTRPVLVPKAAAQSCGNSIKTVGTPPAAGPAMDTLRGEVTSPERESATPLRSEVSSSERGSTLPLRSEVRTEPLEFEQKWKIEAVVSKEVMEKLDRCRSLLSRKYPQGVDYEILLGELTEVFVERKDPERRRRKHKRQITKQKRVPKAPESRHIPAGEKQKVWTRDQGKCAYVSANGRRCNSTHSLQFDHYPVPYARGGPNKASNLRLLCAMHNRFTAGEIFGRASRDKNVR